MSAAEFALGPVAVIVVRAGVLPLGAAEAVAEAGGRAVLVGDQTLQAAGLLGASRVWVADTGAYAVGALAASLAEALADCPLVILPASPDGRDLAPRLAAALGRPLLAGALAVGVVGDQVQAELARYDGRVVVEVGCPVPAVATLVVGARAALPTDSGAVQALALHSSPVPDALVLEVRPPDPSTADLAEAPRVLSGGAGLVPRPAGDAAARATFDLLAAVGARLGASAGATRVITDAGWMGHERQIGTTGVVVAPQLYLAFGVSGASQHVGGLGAPRHIISVNLDPSCPMTAMADLGLVTDARALLAELADRLEVPR